MHLLQEEFFTERFIYLNSLHSFGTKSTDRNLQEDNKHFKKDAVDLRLRKATYQPQVRAAQEAGPDPSLRAVFRKDGSGLALLKPPSRREVDTARHGSRPELRGLVHLTLTPRLRPTALPNDS